MYNWSKYDWIHAFDLKDDNVGNLPENFLV